MEKNYKAFSQQNSRKHPLNSHNNFYLFSARFSVFYPYSSFPYSQKDFQLLLFSNSSRYTNFKQALTIFEF